MHRPVLEQVLIALASAGEASYLAMAQSSMNNSGADGPSVGLHSPNGSAEHRQGGLDSPARPRDLGDVMYAKYQEFWITIGSEVS